MILIWAGEGGGPLQWVGIAVFFLQFFAPQIFHLVIDIQNGRLEVGSVPLLTVACSLAVAIFIGALWVVWDWSLGPDEEDGPRGNGNGVNNETAAGAPADASAPSGSAANPVVIDDDNDDDLWQRIYSLLESFSPTHLMLGLGFILPLAMCAPLLLNALQTNGDMTGFLATTGVLQVTGLAVVAHSIMAIAAYRVLRGVLDDGGVGPYPGNRQGRRRRGRKLTVGEIGDIVAKVPIEEFVSEEDIRTGECSVSRLKRMLVNRGALEAAEKCVERDDLVREIERVRKFNDECAICAEEYVEGDVLRVTPCQHEFHLHCFDKWIYTFATDARPATHPTCPLCKATIQ